MVLTEEDKQKSLTKAVKEICLHIETRFLIPDAKEEREDTEQIGSSWESCSRRIYVEPQAQREGSNSRDKLQTALTDFLLSKAHVFVLIGDPGSGKTTFVKHILKALYAAYQQAPEKHSIPLFISLNHLLQDTKADPSKLLETHLKEVVGLSPNQIVLVKTQQPLLVMCDGYDEISYEGNLYRDNGWSNWPLAKFVITTRPEKFGTALMSRDLRHALVKAFSPELLVRTDEVPTTLVLEHLCPFDKEQVKEFVKQWQLLMSKEIDWSVEEYIKHLDAIPGLTELMSNPIILSLVLYVLPDLAKELKQTSELKHQQVQRTTIYDQFVKKWFTTQVPRIRQKLKEQAPSIEKALHHQDIDWWVNVLREYTTALGRWCLRSSTHGKLTIEIPAKETVKGYLLPSASQEALEKLSSSSEDHIIFLAALRSGCLLNCDGQYFRFFHKSLVEYFAQEHIFKGVVGQLSFVEQCDNLNVALAEVNLLKMLADRAKTKQDFREFLYQVLRESKTNADVAMAASNAITILHYAKQPLNLESWRGIKIPGADLSGAILHEVDFRQANLSGVNFSQAYLNEADLTNSELTGCQWGVPPAIEIGSEVNAVVYLWGTEKLVVGDEGGKIHFIHTAGWVIEKSLKHYNLYATENDEVMALAVDGDAQHPSRWLASGSKGGVIYLWELPGGNYRKKFKHKGLLCLALTSVGDKLASGSRDYTVRLWDVATGQVLTTCQGHVYGVYSVSFSPDGKYLASGSSDRTVRLWDVATGQVLTTCQGHTGYVTSVSFSPDGKRLASGSRDQTVRLWDVTTGQLLTTCQGHTNDVTSVIFSPDGKRLASSGDRTVRLWDVMAGQELTTCQGHTSYVLCVSFSPDGKRLASGSRDNTVRLWDVMAGQELKTCQGHTDGVRNGVRSVIFSPDGKRLVSEGWVNVRLWDVTTGQRLMTYQGYTGSANSVSFSSDGKRLASGSDDNTVRLWDVTTGQMLTTCQGHTLSVSSVSFSPDGKLLASGSDDKTVRLWDVATGQMLTICQGHSEYVTSMIFSPDGKRLASGGRDNTVRLWDVTTGQALTTYQGYTRGYSSFVNSVSFSTDGNHLASGSSDRTVRLWDVATGQVLTTCHGHTDYVTSVIFSPNGKSLASGSEDKTVRLWDTQTGHCLQRIGCGVEVTDIRFSPSTLYIAGYNQTQVQSFVYTSNWQQHYVLTERFNESDGAVDKNYYWQQLKLARTRGLTPSQHQWLSTWGATGKPAYFTYADISQEEQEEEAANLKALRTLKASLQHADHKAVQVPSVFNDKVTVSFQAWAIYLYRITQPTFTGGSSQGSTSNRHVYGLAEGLDLLGRRVFIRFDLVQERDCPTCGRVQVKVQEVGGTDLRAGKQGFIQLCQSKNQPQRSDPEALICLQAGTLQREELDVLLSLILQEAERQLPNAKAQRIAYRLLGGDEQQPDSHNCLSWLRYLLKDFKSIRLPRGTFDAFGVDPKAILPNTSRFFTLPPDVLALDVSSWKSPTPSSKNRLDNNNNS